MSVLAPARNLLFVLPALACSPTPAEAQQVGGTSQGFRLSAMPEGVDTRTFSGSDTLHMQVWGPAVLPTEDGAGAGGSQLSGRWILEGPGTIQEGPLIEGPSRTFTAAFDLALLPPQASAWSWRAELHGGGQVLWSPRALLVVVPVPPSAAFGAKPTHGPSPLTVSFQDQSTGVVSAWSWDFGDGAQSVLSSPAHVYTQAGTYTVALTASNAGGSSTATQVTAITVTDPPEPEFALRMGVNASENVWSQRGIAFADAMARASEFCRVVNGSITPSLAPLIPLGQSPARLGQGWPDLNQLNPGELAGARLFGSMGGTTPDGRVEPYVLTWEGTGSCRLAGNPVVGEANRSSNRVEVFVDPGVGTGNALLFWVLEASDPADPVRDAHVWLPGMESTRPLFWPPFVEKLRALNGGRGPSHWRAMDWNQVRQYGRSDGAAPFVFDLAGRITPASPSQGTRRGLCPEFIVALCNELAVDLHFCLPHRTEALSEADYETFVRDTLRVLRDGSAAVPGVNGDQPFAGLAPERTLTLEFSNELWNPSFPVQSWLRARAQAQGLTFHQAIAAELAVVFGIAQEVFSVPGAPTLRTYVGGWLPSASHLAGILAALPPGLEVGAVGPACYFRPRQSDIDGWLLDAVPGSCPNCPTAEEVVASGRLFLGGLGSLLAAHRELADGYTNPDGSHPELVLYEAGSSFVAGFQPWAGAAVEAQRIPSMFDAYVSDLIPMLVAEGVDEVLWYSFVSDNSAQGNGAGPFGHWDDMQRTITLPVPEPYLDEGQPKAAAIYKLPPLRQP